MPILMLTHDQYSERLIIINSSLGKPLPLVRITTSEQSLREKVDQYPKSIQSRKRSLSKDEGEARRLPASKLPKLPEIQHWGPRARNGLPINPESLQWKQRSRQSGPFSAIISRRKKFFYRGTPWENHYAVYEEDEGRCVKAHGKEMKHEIVALQNPKTHLTGAQNPIPT